MDRMRGTVGMEHLCFEMHLGRLIGEIIWKLQGGLIESTLEGSTLWSLEANSPIEEIIINETN